MKNWAENFFSTNLVFKEHVLDNVFKHLHPFMQINCMSPVLFCPSCNRPPVEFRSRVSLCRINFNRPKQLSIAL